MVVAADALRFTGAPNVGDEISVFADQMRHGRSSMTFAVDVEARDRYGERVFAVASGELTFVVLDENDRPRPIAAAGEMNA